MKLGLVQEYYLKRKSQMAATLIFYSRALEIKNLFKWGDTRVFLPLCH